LGNLYKEGGPGLPKNYAQAAYWYQQMADIATLQWSLGKLYEEGGPGLLRNYAQAMNYYRKAAEHGSMLARIALSRLYAKGLGVKQDSIAASALLSLSNGTNVQNTAKLIDRDYLKLTASLTHQEISLSQELSYKMNSPGNLLIALDQYMEKTKQ
jgi:TPR repeat protein